jgi:two-component system LytT family sensor kinase
MLTIKRSRASIYKEIICWIGLIVYLTCNNYVTGTALAHCAYIVLHTINFMWVYYVLFYIVFGKFYEKDKFIFVLLLILVAISFVTFDYINVKKTLPILGASEFRGQFDIYNYIKHAMIHFTFVVAASLGSYINWRSVEVLKVTYSKERELISKELNFIKNQFNSHFTFNFFNYCYSKTLSTSSKAAQAIENFSEMLLFSLKNESNEYVTLDEEINYIKNFVSIQECITAKVFVNISISGNIENYYILPGIISTLVENSFKHGVFSDEKNPIKIEFVISDNTLNFTIKNKKAYKQIIDTTGIGINEIIELLILFYPDKHTFDIKDYDYEYSTILTLELTSV